MKLSTLSQFFPQARLVGADRDAAHLAYDSRQVTPGTLFVALRGAKSDGHGFAAAAWQQGAIALAVDDAYAAQADLSDASYLVLPDTRAALPQLSALFYGEPSRHMDLIGVTGTNGKTTTSFMVESILRAAGARTGLIGTVGALIDGHPVPLERTTPESADLQRLFSEMRSLGITRVVMEVSSQGILAGRTEQVAYDTGVFTNLTQDHLDAHGTMEEYFAQKKRLFLEYPQAFPEKRFTSVVNADDPYGQELITLLVQAGRPVLSYAVHDSNAMLRASIDELRPDGTRFTVTYQAIQGEYVTFPISLNIGGQFNVSNALAAIGVALQRLIAPQDIQAGLESLAGVPGRFEPIDTGGRGFSVVVDYAHTPDGLENVLSSARALNPKRLICIFGCGGDRDSTKRPKMGRISSELADLTVVTSDNPRTEDPAAIIAQIMMGVKEANSNPNVLVQADRFAAIQTTLCDLASPGDLIVIAGKGHESGQTFADRTIPFDDRQVAREALASCP